MVMFTFNDITVLSFQNIQLKEYDRVIGKMTDNRFKILGYWPRVVKTSQTGSDPDYNLLFQDAIAHESQFTDVLIIT